MNDIDKIKSLLDQPNVESISANFDKCDIGYISTKYTGAISSVGQILGKLYGGIEGYYFDHDRGGDWAAPDSLKSYHIKWVEWPEIGEGDTVMTPHGEGVVAHIDNNARWSFEIRLEHGGSDWLERHEIALISKAIK